MRECGWAVIQCQLERVKNARQMEASVRGESFGLDLGVRGRECVAHDAKGKDQHDSSMDINEAEGR